MGAVVIAIGVEHDHVVRFVLHEAGRIVDEYLSVPEYYGPLPPGDAIALAANPRVVARLTGAEPAAVRAVARTALSLRNCRRRRSCSCRSPPRSGSKERSGGGRARDEGTRPRGGAGEPAGSPLERADAQHRRYRAGGSRGKPGFPRATEPKAREG